MIDTLKQGEELFAQGFIEEALGCFQSVVRENPNLAEAVNDLAVACLALGDTRSGERHLCRAIEVQPDYVEARINLADLYMRENRLVEAEAVLEQAVARGSDNPDLTRLLLQIYVALGHRDKARALVERSRSLNTGLKLADAFWSAIRFWELAEDLSLKERLEGVVASCLAAIDGRGSPHVAFKLVADDAEAGEPLAVIQGLERLWSEAGDISPRAGRLSQKRAKGLTPPLTVKETQDWHYFRIRLLREINSEGGCLGDLTQTKKVLTKDERLQKYDLEATIQYLKENLGPCDCHVYRGIEV